jgi:hypothetical protein
MEGRLVDRVEAVDFRAGFESVFHKVAVVVNVFVD